MKKSIIISVCVIAIAAVGFSQQIMNYVNRAYVAKVEEQLQIALSQLPKGVEIDYESIDSARSFNEAKIHKPILLYNKSPLVELDGDLFIKTYENKISLKTNGKLILTESGTTITNPISINLNKEIETPYTKLNIDAWLRFVNLIDIQIGQGKVLHQHAGEAITLTESDQFLLKITRDHPTTFNDLVKFQTEIKNLSFPGFSPEVLEKLMTNNQKLLRTLGLEEVAKTIISYPEIFGNHEKKINLQLSGKVNYPNQNALDALAQFTGEDAEAKAFEWLATHGYHAEVVVAELSDVTSTLDAKLEATYQYSHNPQIVVHLDGDLSVTSEYDQFVKKLIDLSVTKISQENDPKLAHLVNFYHAHQSEILELVPQFHKAGSYKLKSDLTIELDLAEYDLLVDYGINYQVEKPGYEFDVKGNFKPYPFKTNSSTIDLEPDTITFKVKNYAKLIHDIADWVNGAQKVFVDLNPAFQRLEPEQVDLGIIALKHYLNNPNDSDSEISFTVDYSEPNNVKINGYPVGNLR